MYTFDAIILEKQIIREKNIRITALTKDYGKITLWYRKQLTGVDIGDIARIVSKRENSINLIKSIESHWHVISSKWTYETLLAFLSVIKILKICTTDEEASPRIFADYHEIMKILTHTPISKECCQLFQMRIFKHLGTLNPNFFEGDHILQYMYNKIHTTPLEKIISKNNIRPSHQKIIETSNLFSLSTFL